MPGVQWVAAIGRPGGNKMYFNVTGLLNSIVMAFGFCAAVWAIELVIEKLTGKKLMPPTDQKTTL